ncbi:TonB-dependent receptor [Capsulimonas corticalis]|uniref:TonB-dependent receptor n=1 Tax=Capsulimonas corticalis TaxID=2219043 RepID=A0A402D1L5_9BACT|nr:TonB-dependent receptor [Capsulimonas corticalis]BDI28661.1 TonB-dependent receptor [Capsulimonas corticalis]
MSTAPTNFFVRSLVATTLLCAAATAVRGASPVMAAAGRSDTSEDMELLLSDQVIVTTATKTAGRVSDSPAALTVITEDQIRASGARTLTALLRSAPGVDVMDVNSSQSNVSIRGFNDQFSNKLLVMVDGRSIYQDFYGAVFWQQEPLLLSRIKQIEIVRGPGSTLYGANAFSGVINIITKTPQEIAAGTKTFLTAERGGENGSAIESYAGGKSGAWSYSVGGGYNSSDGYGSEEKTRVPDAHSTHILMADAQRALPGGVLRLSVNTNDSKSDFSSIFLVPDGDWRSRNYTASYDQDHARNPLQIRAFVNTLDLSDPAGLNIQSRIVDFDAQQQHVVSNRNQLVYGLDYRTSEIKAFLTANQNKSRSTWSVFGQDEARLGAKTTLFAGMRLDHDSAYGETVSPHVSLVHHLDAAQTIRVSYGSAFRAPTLLDNYFNFSVPIIPDVLTLQLGGNLHVRPEKIHSYEIGYRREMKDAYVGVNAFYNQISDLMYALPTTYAPSPPFPPNTPLTFMSENIGGARAMGVELESAFPVARGLRGQFNYSYQDVKDDKDGPISFSPAHKANLALETVGGSRVSFRTDLHYVGKSIFRDLYHNDVRYDIHAYLRADLKIAYQFGPAAHPWRAFTSATNLLGDGHREFPQAPSPLSSGAQSAAAQRVIWLGVESR